MEKDGAAGSKVKLKRRPPYYSLRRPNQATQTNIVQKPPPKKLDSTVQVWHVTEDPKTDKMAQLLNRSVQCITPSVPKSLIIIILLTTFLCGMAAYITRGNLYDPLPPAHGQGYNLRDTLVDLTCAVVKPFIGFLAKT